MAAAILRFPTRNPAAEAEAAGVHASSERLAKDAAMLARLADDYAGGNPGGNPFVSVALGRIAESLMRQRQDLLAWAAARAGATEEPRPDAEPPPALGAEPRPERTGPRYGARPCGVPGCTARVRLDLEGDRCGVHSAEAARRRAAAEARRARERLHAAVTRMA